MKRSVKVDLSLRAWSLIIGFFTLVGFVGLGVAYNANGIGGNPAIMGHSADEIVGGTAKIIVCSQVIYTGIPSTGSYAFKFNSTDCGGTLPDNTYLGVLKSVIICGGTQGAAAVLDSGESTPTSSQGTVSGPGLAFWADSPCYFSDGTGRRGLFSVAYFKK